MSELTVSRRAAKREPRRCSDGGPILESCGESEMS